MSLTAAEILAGYDQEYNDAQQGLRFQPPLGDYTEIIESVEVKYVTRQKKKVPAIQIVGMFLSGDFEGKRNSLGCFTPNIFGMLKDIIDILGGDPDVGLLDAATFLQGRVGTVVNVSVTESENGGKKYKNANITGEIYGSESDAAPVEDAPQADADEGTDEPPME